MQGVVEDLIMNLIEKGDLDFTDTDEEYSMLFTTKHRGKLVNVFVEVKLSMDYLTKVRWRLATTQETLNITLLASPYYN